MRVLLLGGSGLLGADVRAAVPEWATVIAPSSAEVDVGDAFAVDRALDRHRPEYVINAAAYTHVDRAEAEPGLAHRVNAEGPRHLGRACAARGVRIAHVSTDYVFPGGAAAPYRESDPTGPVNTYGRTKLAGEQALLESGADALVVRTSWLYGLHGRSFPQSMRARARQGMPTRVVNDQFGRPTWTADLAAALWALIGRGASGVLHVSSSGPVTTWFEIARVVFSPEGAAGLLAPCTTAEYPTAALRPAWSALDTSRVEALLGAPLPDWRVSLEEFLEQLGRRGD